MTREAYEKDNKNHNIFENVAIRAYEYYIAVETLKILDGVFVTEQHRKCANARLDVAMNYLKELKS